MTFAELVRARRSVRRFASTPVSRDDLEALLDAARLAPSACNLQPWRFIVVTAREELDRLAACYARDWFRTAPAAIVVCGDRSRSWKRRDGKDHVDVDAAIATDHLTLAAAERGLGTCWICAFDAPALRALLGLPEAWEPVVLLPIGHPADEPPPPPRDPPRKPLTEIVRWGLPA